jgi:ABC-type transport system involved in multi-copper enzyme maturation permease subunit
MRVPVIALNTLAGLLRNKLLILFLAIFLCALLLALSPLMIMKRTAQTATLMESQVPGLVGGLMSLISGCGSLLAAWLAAQAVADEMKSGTILAVLARPVRRWEFLLGKYFGILMLMALYVLFMFGFSYLLAWVGGERIQTTPWVLLVYPLLRYAIYGALAMFLVTRMHPVTAFAIVLVTAFLASALQPGRHSLSFLPDPLTRIAYALLPSTYLLSESRFLTITQASLQKVTWDVHAITLGYGLDYALVWFLLAVWSFQRLSLLRA